MSFIDIICRLYYFNFSQVLDSPDRLRDTLVHEMCHAASWIISGYRDGHGHIWKNWATRAMNRFPELPVIARCHSYEIRTKYVYRCQSCKAGNMEDRISIRYIFL